MTPPHRTRENTLGLPVTKVTFVGIEAEGLHLT
jgi:hypothetical protein